ncbi:MAG: N-acetyl-gamma-glutamyl-phosphate reductase [Proteobacteria bacterium]|nr:N-acetyl-gamma-glutamyl-phosphate reductase [Pseudomonadota bacterium]
MLKVAVVGARGYVGLELLKLLDIHPHAKVVAAFSRAFVGMPIHTIVEGFTDTQLCYQADELDILKDMDLDVIFLALPNEVAKQHKTMWQKISNKVVIIDLSSDFRFDDDWTYGQPEINIENIIGTSLIANPGCYATAAQLGLLPILAYIDAPPSIFGVSGYSGAGSKPNENNDPERLAHNLKAYKLINHIHQQEISHVLGRPVYFMPHIAEFFRGIHLTLSIQLNTKLCQNEIEFYYKQYYQGCALIKVSNTIPEVQQVQNTHNVLVGGYMIKDKHLVLCVCIDNLLKGAATQAIQNMNLALKQEINLGIIT